MAYITINKQNFYHNLTQIARKTSSIEKIAIVLKDNAYGHGLSIIAKMASDFGICQAVVRDISEARQIKQLFTNTLVLGGEMIADNRLSFTINSLSDIDKAPIGTRVELKVDTGMHRNGISISQIDQALKQIAQNRLTLIGVMTHYRSADELTSELFWQQKEFSKVKDKIAKAGLTPRYHSSNSSTILRVNSFNEDLVRVGIGAFGYNELPPIFDQLKLLPVLSLYATKISSRTIYKNQRVGYGGAETASKDMQVSTYDIGYGDGWMRRDYTTPEDIPIIGRVSMDFISLASTKETICIMDNAQKAGKQLGTISYEVLTRLDSRICRLVV